MQKRRGVVGSLCCAIALTFALAALVGPAFAKKEPKTYPEQGKIVGVGTKTYVGAAPTLLYPSYRVETDTKVFELLCGNRKGCGGDKKLDIGDALHFRLDQYHGARCAYIVAPEGHDASREERLLILSEDLKSEAKPADSQPTKSDAKPQ
jgi:hypothetical protein